MMPIMNKLAYDREATEAMFAAEGAMTKDQFLSYAHEALFGEGVECLYERIAEIGSEIAMFGDSGPGSLYRLRQDVAEYNRIAARYEQFTGRQVRRLSTPSPR